MKKITRVFHLRLLLPKAIILKRRKTSESVGQRWTVATRAEFDLPSSVMDIAGNRFRCFSLCFYPILFPWLCVMRVLFFLRFDRMRWSFGQDPLDVSLLDRVILRIRLAIVSCFFNGEDHLRWYWSPIEVLGPWFKKIALIVIFLRFYTIPFRLWVCNVAHLVP